MRPGTRDWLAAQEAIASRRDREERWSQPSVYNRYDQFLSDSRQKRIDDLAAQREMEKQSLANRGQLDVENRRQTGATTRTGMTEGGATERLGMTEAGTNQRFGTEQENRFKYLAQQQAGDQDLERLRGMNQLGLLDAREKKELDLLEKEFDLRSQEPLYREFTTTDPLGGTTSTWRDVKSLDQDLADIEAIGAGTFTNAPTRTGVDNQLLDDYERSATEALGTRRRTQPISNRPTPAQPSQVKPTRALSTMNESNRLQPRSPYNTDRLAPLKSVGRSLNQTIGSGADALVRRYQRDPYDF